MDTHPAKWVSGIPPHGFLNRWRLELAEQVSTPGSVGGVPYQVLEVRTGWALSVTTARARYEAADEEIRTRL